MPVEALLEVVGRHSPDHLAWPRELRHREGEDVPGEGRFLVVHVHDGDGHVDAVAAWGVAHVRGDDGEVETGLKLVVEVVVGDDHPCLWGDEEAASGVGVEAEADLVDGIDSL